MEPCEATTNRRMMAVAIFSIYETWQQVMQNSIIEGSRKYLHTYSVLDLQLTYQLWLDVALGYLFFLRTSDSEKYYNSTNENCKVVW